MTRLFGVDIATLETAGVPTAQAAAIEVQLREALTIPGSGTWWDTHVHVGRDVDGHELDVTSLDRKSTRLNSSHSDLSRMPSSA